MKKIFLLLLFTFFIQINLMYSGNSNGFTQGDRERLIRLEATLKVFMDQTDKRFEQVDKRFEQVDKRINEFREDMNKRFAQMMNFLWMLVTIFTTLTGVVIGFAYWDRKTIVKKA